ncbi:unnamed protein product, partial [Brassica napus]
MSEHVCFVYSSESVNGTNAGKKSLPEDKGPDVPADASSSKDKAPEPSLQSPYTANSTAKVIIPNKKLADWLKTFIIEHLSIKNHSFTLTTYQGTTALYHHFANRTR